MRKHLGAFVFIVALLGLAGQARGQQPSEQGPPPSTCEQAVRENAAYRDRIASLERQLDATNEEAKTFYLRAAHLEELRSELDRLIAHYRGETAALRYDLAEARAEVRELRRRTPRAGRRPGR